jgi:hypothetical protein
MVAMPVVGAMEEMEALWVMAEMEAEVEMVEKEEFPSVVVVLMVAMPVLEAMEEMEPIKASYKAKKPNNDYK